MSNLIQKVIRKWKLVSILVVLLIITLFVVTGDNNEIMKVVVTRGDLVEEVSVTGITKSQNSVHLAFDRSGRIGAVLYKEGNRVVQGSKIAELETADISASLRQAEASVGAERAQLDELLRGTRQEDLEISRIKVKNAESALLESEKGLLDAARDAYVKSDDAVRTRLDQFFVNPRTNPALVFYMANSQLRFELEYGRRGIETELMEWGNELSGALGASVEATVAETAIAHLKAVKALLEQAVLAINDARVDQNVSQASLDAWKATLSTGRVNVSSAESNLRSALESRSLAVSALELSRRELTFKQAGASKEEIEAQRSALAEAEAKRDNARAELLKAAIRAPFTGVIAKQDAKVGEIAVAGTPLTVLITDRNFEIEAKIPEVDIVKVKKGNAVSITFDALPEEAIQGVIGFIDPAETLIDGVAYYKSKVYVASDDPRIMSGLTANLDIEVMRKNSVLLLPQHAVYSRESKRYAKRIIYSGLKETQLVIGSKGKGGLLEIVSGLDEGDLVMGNTSVSYGL